MSADSGGSTVPRRQLGRKLRELREAVPLTVAQAITALEWSKPRLWRYETGQVPIHPNDVDTMCRVYGADPSVTEALKELARQSKAKGWWHAYSDIPEWFQLFLGMESAASRLRQYEAEVIPGLLQSPGYARAMISRGPIKGLPPESVERRTEMRMQRQQILTRKDPKAPQLDVVLSESALVRGFTPKIMTDQLACLLAFAERPNVSIRVLPFSAGPHTAYQGAFVILDFPRESTARDPEPTTIYQESPTGSLYLDKPSEVETYSSIWDDLSTVAFDQPASRALIEEKAKEWSR
ncbi:helix-turn-helix domain-containing protein [Paractinoplanes lichenicola]|uniref:helix-turn-helix domain-containing protein n=1 Tax=Paractinoplanes lichenicola TaxID=2802976 RepID=UPI0027DCF5B1|nr:helix-turn-helix transcriptional regulator [Actinoplanes lichenicola]